MADFDIEPYIYLQTFRMSTVSISDHSYRIFGTGTGSDSNAQKIPSIMIDQRINHESKNKCLFNRVS